MKCVISISPHIYNVQSRLICNFCIFFSLHFEITRDILTLWDQVLDYFENIRILEVSNVSRKISEIILIDFREFLYQSVLPRIIKLNGYKDSNVYWKGEILGVCNAVLEKTDHFS